MESLSATNIQSWLTWFLRGVLILSFLVLFGRLTELQIIKGDYYRVLAEENRIRRVPIFAPRGKILARGGEVLVDNKKIKKKVIFNPVEGFEKSLDVEGSDEDEVIEEWTRDYPMGEAAAHITGYIGEADGDEVGKVRAQCPEKGPRALGSWVGRSGLEEQYDCLLAGVDGEELVEVDSNGNKVRTLGQKNAIPGDDIHTNIDYDLQIKVAEIMKGEKGTAIVNDTKGEILALYSTPSFDPNIFVNSQRSSDISGILQNSELPLFDRAIGGLYPPGSVYKPIVSVAALEEDAIDGDFSYNDTGQIVIDSDYGRFTYSNWYFTQYGGTEGEIKLDRALTRSTDTFFYKVGELLGVDKLVKWSNKLGLNQKTGVDLPGEVAGLIPDPQWKMKVKGERWFLGNTYHMSIGQGDIALTPLGVDRAITTIANGGFLCSPSIIHRDEGKCEDLNIEKDNLNLIIKGMVGACSPGGTGVAFFDFQSKWKGIKPACKTGTAETTDDKDPHAWFVVFAPSQQEENIDDKKVNDTEIVTTVMIENGGEGSQVAAPLAREILDYWFGLKNVRN
jgi:penicillin-binding protein 2